MNIFILAGGSGSRLWPFSRHMTPKQFLNLGSTHESLLQETCRRLEGLAHESQIRVIGSKFHEYELKQQLQQVYSEFPEANLLLEPVGRNTAPAVLWGLNLLSEKDLQDPLLILPADHLIGDLKSFREAVSKAEVLCRSGFIVTFGIKPERPETGYGYLKSGSPLDHGYRLERFVEKPDQQKALEYLKSEEYTWNAGIFMSTAQVLMDAFQDHAGEMYSVFSEAKNDGADLLDQQIVQKLYQAVKNQSIDYAVMEHVQNAAVLPVSMDWSDLGSWESLYDISKKDVSGNVLRGNVISHDTKNSLIFSTKKLVTSIGVENLLIVETEDALLVCDLKKSQDVKKLVETLKEEDRHEYRFHTRVLRPWGSVTIIRAEKSVQIRMLEVNPRSWLSKQKHQHRSEHWVVIEGEAEILNGTERRTIAAGESTFIPKGTLHQLGNPTQNTLQLIEVQMGEHLGANDIERFE